jgi:dynein heavy chain
MQLGELLITATLRHEMPELEAEHGSLIKQRAKNASEIASLEEQVLRAINTTRVEALLEESDVYNMLVALQVS